MGLFERNHLMKARLFLGIFLLTGTVALHAQPPKVPDVKEAPKVKSAPKVPEVKAAPKAPEVKAPPKAPEVKAPPKVPEVKAPPKVPTIKEPPKVPSVKAPPNIPKVPKAPPEVKVPPKVPVVKEPPKVPKVVEVKPPPKAPVVKEAPKTPKVAEVKQPPKAPVVKEAPATPKVVEVKPSTPKTHELKEGPKAPKVTEVKTPKADQPVITPTRKPVGTVAGTESTKSPATPSSTPSTASAKGGSTKEKAPAVASESTRRNAARKGEDAGEQQESIDDVLARSRARQDDPAYFRQGGKEDDQQIARFRAENLGSEELLETALQGGKINAEEAEGRVQDVLILEEYVQSGGVDPDDPEVVRVKKDILEGRVPAIGDVRKRVNVIGNKAVDVLEGEAPKVDVKDLERKGDRAKARGNSKLAQQFYEQAIDAIKNGGETNSPQYRAQVIAEVSLGYRPVSDLKRVAVTVKTPPAPTTPNSTTVAVGPGIVDVGVPAGPGFQAPEVPATVETPVAAAPGSVDTAPGPDAGPGPAPEAPAPDSQPAAPAPEVATSPGPNTPATSGPGTPGPDAAGPSVVVTSEVFPDGRTVETTRDATTGAVIKKEVTIWFSDGTVRFESYDAEGNFIEGETMQPISVSPGGRTADASHTNPNTGTSNNQNNSSSSDPNTGTSGANGSNGSNDASSDSNDDDDDKDGGGNDQPAPMTAAEQETVDDIQNSQNSSETVVVTPRPPGFEKDRGTGTELAEATGGRMGRAEAQQALARLELKASGNGTAGPSNPTDRTRASGVLLTPEEKGNADRALNMATGGGLVNPVNDGNGPTYAVTDRDLKEIQLRGNGGAKGPTDTPATPTTPQDPNSPIAGPGPITGPAPRGANAATQNLQVAPSVQVAPNLSTEAVQQVRQGN